MQQRKRAHAGEVGPHRVGGIGGGDVDGQIAIGVALIGAKVGNLRLQYTACKRGVDRGGGEARIADVELGCGNARLQVDIIEAVDVDRRIAPGLACGIAGAARHRDRELLEIEVEFHQRLARQIDRGPAVERGVAERAGDAVDHHDRAVEPDFSLGGERGAQQVGRVDLDLGRDILPLDRGCGRRRLDLEFQRMAAPARAAGQHDLAVGIDGDVGVDGLDPPLDAVAQVGKHDGAAGDADVLDRKGVGRLAGSGLRRRIGLPHALAAQRQVHHRADDNEFGDVWPAGPQAGERHVRLDACGREAAVDVAVLRILQRDIVQRDVERWPQADLGAAIDGELVAGLALDPLLDLRRQEARRDADHQQQYDDDDHGANGGAGNFQCSHIDIPDRASGTYFGGAIRRRNRSGELIPEGVGPKKPKIFRGTAKLCDL